MKFSSQAIAYLVFFCFPSSGYADLIINVGDHVLQPNQPNQRVDLVISTTDNSTIQGINLRARLGDGDGPMVEPVFNGTLNTLEAVIFSDGANGLDYIWDDHLIDISGRAPGASSGMLGAQYAAPNANLQTPLPEILADGIVASFLIDTTGITSGTFDFDLKGISGLGDSTAVSGFTQVPITITNGTISITSVPEPSSLVIALIGLGFTSRSRRRKQNKLPCNSSHPCSQQD